MKTIKIQLEYKCYPVWIYDEYDEKHPSLFVVAVRALGREVRRHDAAVVHTVLVERACGVVGEHPILDDEVRHGRLGMLYEQRVVADA